MQFRRGFLEAAEPACGFEGTQRIEWRQYPLHSQEFI
jgi:hypothetical protein